MMRMASGSIDRAPPRARRAPGGALKGRRGEACGQPRASPDIEMGDTRNARVKLSARWGAVACVRHAPTCGVT